MSSSIELDNISRLKNYTFRPTTRLADDSFDVNSPDQSRFTKGGFSICGRTLQADLRPSFSRGERDAGLNYSRTI